MNEFVTILSALVEHGPALLLGVTAVLLAGVLAMLLHRAPLQRRWLGLVTAVGVGLYLVVGLWPLPRLALRTADSEQQALGADAIAGLTAEQRLSRLQAALASLDDGSQPASSQPASAQLPATDLASVNSAADAIAAPAATSRWSWPLLLAAVYTCGVALMLLRLLVGRLRLGRLLAGCKPVPSAHWRGIQLPRGTRILSSPRAVRPFCSGVWRPVVVVPRSLLAESDAVALHAVLRHEAAHLSAGDARALALLSWLSVPLFCHPLFWWLCREVRFCSELLADEAAAATEGREQYARALIELAERNDPTVAAVGTIAVFRRPSEFYRRIQMLLQRQGSLSMSASRLRRVAQSTAMLCLVGAAGSLFGVPAAAQEPASSLQQQNAELRQAIELLRSELQALRSQMGASPKAAIDTFSRVEMGTIEHQASLPLPQDPLGETKLNPVSGAGGEALLRQTAWRPYVIQKGDSLAEIAQRELGNAALVDRILARNPGLAAEKLVVGMRIRLPTADRATNEAVTPGQGPGSREAASALADLAGMRIGLPTADRATNEAVTPGQGLGSLESASALADLASRYLDLKAELDVQEESAARLKSLAAAGQIEVTESKAAATRLRALERKVEIVGRLIDGEIAATEAELRWLTTRRVAASPAEVMPIEQQMDRARTRLEVLGSVK